MKIDKRRSQIGKLLAATAVCLMMFSGFSDTLAVNTYVRDLKGMAVPVQTYNVSAPLIALTFDVGTSSDHIPDLLNTLSASHVKATFFLTGEWVEKHPLTAKEIERQGHQIGRSLYSERSATDLSDAELQAELDKTDAAWKKVGLPDTHLFRVPNGDAKGAVAKKIRERHDDLISYSANVSPDPGNELQDGLQSEPMSLNPGDILRLHADASSAKLLQGLLQRVKSAGFETCTITRLQTEVAGE